MDFNEKFESVKNKASEAAQTAAAKAKSLAKIAKANIDIRSEQEKQKKAYTELGKLFYRDFITGEASDEAEYLPWCDKVTESVRKVNELRDMISDLKAKEEPADAEADECPEECSAEKLEEQSEENCEAKSDAVGKISEFFAAAKEKAKAAAESAGECAEEIKEDVCECADEIKPEA